MKDIKEAVIKDGAERCFGSYDEDCEACQIACEYKNTCHVVRDKDIYGVNYSDNPIPKQEVKQ